MDSYLHLATFPDVKPGLEELKQLNVRLAILSNGEPRMLRETVKNAGLSKLIDIICSVDSVQVFKPSPRVYDLLPSGLKIEKEKIGFVSSNSWDVSGAGSAGFTTFWIQRSILETQEELGSPPTYVVNGIRDLCRFLSQQNT